LCARAPVPPVDLCSVAYLARIMYYWMIDCFLNYEELALGEVFVIWQIQDITICARTLSNIVPQNTNTVPINFLVLPPSLKLNPLVHDCTIIVRI
jgi:hypothetical protein